MGMTLPSCATRLALTSLLLLMPAAWADLHVDHDRAQAARARGEALPLTKILALVEREFRGDVIEIEFERDDGETIYEVEILLPDGRVIELEVNARTGELLKLEGARLETTFKPLAAAAAVR